MTKGRRGKCILTPIASRSKRPPCIALNKHRIDPAIEKRIQAQLRTGKGMLKVARECGVGSGTAQRIKQEMKGPFAVVAA
jgi:hypothetical protein